LHKRYNEYFRQQNEPVVGIESEVWVNADADSDINGNNNDVVHKKPEPGEDDKDK